MVSSQKLLTEDSGTELHAEDQPTSCSAAVLRKAKPKPTHIAPTHLLPFRTVLSRMKTPTLRDYEQVRHTHNIDKTLTKVSGAQTDGVGWVSGHCSSEVWQLARRTREHLKSHMNPMVLLWYYSRRKCCSTHTVSPKGASHLL